ncbi:lipoyl synthase [Halomicrococcus sp. NG-SE-24]|uniref:lipoyl synthase n=1 Tax=Halomicrococcus sp. NG-SE-24 TaxID=3436928 RepID=UPI003D98EDD2
MRADTASFCRRASNQPSMSRRRKPDWLKMQPPSGQEFTGIKQTLRDHDLHTVCEEANCPNLGECWSGRGSDSGGTATFMLMGDQCTRNCGFCDVDTGGGQPLDPDEPANVASAVAEIGLDYVVLTSVDRDDLEGQGAAHFARTIREIKERDPSILVEVLIPDFQGDEELIGKIIDAKPDVVAHNVETVERLQQPVRDPRAGYEQSLAVLEQVERESDIYTKTSIMLGVGEYDHEVYQTLSDLREVEVDVVTLGQYLQPSRTHLDVESYVHPAKFETWRRVAEDELGFLYCASGPMVRSSYKAGELFVDAVVRDGKSVEEARDEARRAVSASD